MELAEYRMVSVMFASTVRFQRGSGSRRVIEDMVSRHNAANCLAICAGLPGMLVLNAAKRERDAN